MRRLLIACVVTMAVCGLQVTPHGQAQASTRAARVSATQASASPAAGTPLWQNVNPGGGGQVQWVYPDPNLPGRLYELADEEGLYRSDDYGATWRYLGKNLLTGDTRHLVVEPARPGQQPGSGIAGKEPRLYLGTNYGLEYSDDAGVNWTPITSTAIMTGTPFDTLAVDPNNPDNVYAAPSWEEDDCFCFTPHAFQPNGTRVIYVSRDRGQTWSEVAFTSTVGYRQVFSISIDPTSNSSSAAITGSQTLYLGADAGVYRSTDAGQTWREIPKPTPQPGDPYQNVYDHSLGAALSPDGQYIFATYAITIDASAANVTQNTSIYVARTGSSNAFAWREVGAGLADPANGNQNGDYWRPEMDPRSSSTAGYKLLTGVLQHGNYGLFEGSFTVGNGGAVSGSWTKVFENRPNTAPVQNNIGWNNLQPHVREYTYTPTSWPARRVWMASQQSVYVGSPDDPTNWQPASTAHVADFPAPFEVAPYNSPFSTMPSYASNGIASTFNYDMEGYKNYLVQGQADNGVVESWDGGKSWIQRMSDEGRYYTSVQPASDDQNDQGAWFLADNGDSFLTVPVSPVLVLAGVGPWYGGGWSDDGFLLALQLNHLDPTDLWKPIAGGEWQDPLLNAGLFYYCSQPNQCGTTKTTGGLPKERIETMAYDPGDPRRVAVGTHQGISMTADIVSLYNNNQSPAGQFKDIGGDIGGGINLDDWSFKSVAFDPANSNVLYAMAAPWQNFGYGYGTSTGQGRVFKATFDGTKWNWSVIYPEGGAGNARSGLSVWAYDGTTYVAISLDRSSEAGDPTAVYLSSDGGSTFKEVLTVPQAVALKSGPDVSWYDPSRNKLFLSGLAGYQDQLFVTAADHAYNRGYAALKGTIQPDGTVQWVDWTGDSRDGEGSYFPLPDSYKTRVITTDAGTYVYFATEGMGMWRRAFEPTPPGGSGGSPTPELGSGELLLTGLALLLAGPLALRRRRARQPRRAREARG